MPSATVWRSRLWARAMIARTTSWCPLLVCIDDTNERSIFTVSPANRCNRVSEEYPVPKSSMWARIPRWAKALSVASRPSGSRLSVLSVSSSRSTSPGRPVCSRIAPTSAMSRPGSSNCTLETLTLMLTSSCTRPASRHRASWPQAVSITSRPSGAISPLSSATGMNLSGVIGRVPRGALRPPCERFEPGEATRRQVHHGLVGDLEAPLLDDAAKLHLEVQSPGDVVVEVIAEDRDPAPPRALGLVHCEVGVAHHLGGCRSGSAQSDADARTDHDAPVLHVERLGERVEDALRDLGRGVG